MLEDVLYETHRENLDITTENISFSNTIRKKLNEVSNQLIVSICILPMVARFNAIRSYGMCFKTVQRNNLQTM